ncbi:MAG: protein translocase subunit SecDF [Bacteroidia bacterium]|nr:protein translocase subunit SecDF [Bacteroidia bacterium]
MQSKGAIRFLAIAFAVACIFQLSFTWVSRNVESNAAEFANGNEAKKQSYLDSMQGQYVYNSGFKKYTYRDVKERELNLGLDLKGGMNVTLEISLVDLIKNISNNPQDVKLNAAITRAIEMQKNSQENFVTLFGKAFKEVAAGQKLATLYTTLELKNRVTFQSSNDQVLAVINEEAKGAIDRSFNIIRSRIDKFGVAQPNIQLLGNSGRILVELPGVKEPERVRKLLQGTANLEFWETYDNQKDNIANLLVEANKKIAALRKANGTAKLTDTTDATADVKDTVTIAKTGLSALKAEKKGPMSKADSTQKLREENPLFQYMQPAVYQTDKGFMAGEGPVVGMSAIKDTAKINELLSDARVRSVFPRNLRFLWNAKTVDKEGQFLQLVAIKASSRDGKAPLDGGAIADASGDYGQSGAKGEVSMAMSPDGAQIWKRLTKDNIGKSIAIVLDNRVYSFPTVQAEISGGRSSITGNFTINEAKDLANILKAGKMPAPARIVEEAIVGPSLGKESITAGVLSFGIALVLVLVFMAFYYAKAGWVANIALIANVFFIMGVLTSIGAVLTLPGIAGIVLAIGLSVDANILIFERIREELNKGTALTNAISDGFKGAMSSILDSNITTLLLGIVLFLYGTGPVKGFATTMIIGILTSLFSAIFITRLVFEYMLRKNQDISFSIPATKSLFSGVNFNFVGNRSKYYMFSGAVIAAGIISFFVRGFDYGVDFEGGRSYQVKFDNVVAAQDVRTALTPVLESAPEVKTFGGDQQVKITTTYLIQENTEVADATVESKINEGLAKTGLKYEIVSSQKVGPTIADDIQKSALYAVLLSCVIMFLFILVRFQKWQYGLGAVLALVHDVAIVLSVYTLLHGILPFSLEIDQHFIAAILTVMSYSMTDTVVVFDRIREYLSEKGKNNVYGTEKKSVINYALNATLSRTVLTSSTIFIVLLAIFLFGGEVIRGFSFALLVGIVIGTYSSICIATPIVIDLDNSEEKEEIKVDAELAIK